MAGIKLETLQELFKGYVRDGTDHWDYDGNSLELETGLMLYSLVRRMRPLVCMETGTWKGFSGSFIAAALRDNHEGYPNLERGHLYTIDCADQGGAERFRSLGLDDYVSCSYGDSAQLVPKRIPVDFFFLDAGHSIRAVTSEYAQFKQWFNPLRVTLVLHDTTANTGDELLSTAWVSKALREDLAQNYKEVARLRMRNMRGLDILQADNLELP